jgi:hypothetical protein
MSRAIHQRRSTSQRGFMVGSGCRPPSWYWPTATRGRFRSLTRRRQPATEDWADAASGARVSRTLAIGPKASVCLATLHIGRLSVCSAAREKDSSEMILALPTRSPTAPPREPRTDRGPLVREARRCLYQLTPGDAGPWPGSVKTRDAFVSAVESGDGGFACVIGNSTSALTCRCRT